MKRLLTSFALTLSLIATVATVGCESPTADAPADGNAAPLGAEAQSALAALPADARLLAVADAQALRRSGLFDGEEGPGYTGETGARMKNFFDATGFAPEKDVRKVYVAASGTDGTPPQLALAADFDGARFQEQLGGEFGNRFEQSTHGGQTVYQRTRSGDGSGRSLAFALTPDGLILLSDPAGVRAMLDRLDAGSGSAAESDRLMRFAERVRGRGDTWFVARGLPGLASGVGIKTSTKGNGAGGPPEQLRRLQQVVKHAAGAVSMTPEGRTAEGELFLYTQEGAAPADLRQVLEGLASAAGRSENLSPEHRRTLENLDIEEQQDAVRVGFSVPVNGE